MGVEVRVFGSFRMMSDGQTLGARDFGGRKPKQLLEILVLTGGRHVAKDRLANLLWGDDLPQHAAGSLEHYVSMLRRRLTAIGADGFSLVVTEHGGYRFDADRGRVDLDRFDALYDTALAASDRPAMEEALGLVTGDLLEDEPYAEWAQRARQNNCQRRLRLHVATGELALAEGDHHAAGAHGRAALALDGLDEAAVRLLMTASYRAGDRTGALRAFDRFRAELTEEVGADPMPATLAVYEGVLRQAPRAAASDRLPSLGSPLAPDAPAVPRTADGPVRVRPATSPHPTAATPLPGQRRRPSVAPWSRGAADRPGVPAPDAAAVPALDVGTAGSWPPFIGRDQELDACLALSARAGDAPGLRSVLVDGELGVGKTALLDQLARRLAGSRTVRISCTRHTAGVAGSLLENAVGHLAGPDATGIQALLRALERRAASPASLPLPVLRQLDLDLAIAPFALLVDDAHLADDCSLAVLAALGRRRAACRGTVVMTADLGRAPHGSAVHRYAPDLRIGLGPLTPQDLLALGVPELYERTGGLPLLVAGCGADGGTRVSADVAARVLGQLREAGERTWRVLVACAMATGDFGVEEVARLADVDLLEAAEVQDQLCAERVLTSTGERYRFRHPLVGQIVRDAVTAGRRRTLQRRVRSAAAATDRRGGAGSPPDGRERRAGADRRRCPGADLPPSRTLGVPG